MGETSEKGPWWARILIIIYAAAIIAIGVQPIRTEHGGFFSYLGGKASWVWNTREESQGRYKRARMMGVDEAPVITPNEPQDSLSNKDRKALENLIDGL